MDLSEDDTSESESESSMLDDDDDDDRLSDDHNLIGAGGGGGDEQNSMPFQDHTAVQLGRSGGSGLGGASLRNRGDQDRDDDSDIDFLKRRARELQSVLHSQETHFDGAAGGGGGGSNGAMEGGASLMPKLDLADPGGGGRVRRRWDDYPSATGLGSVHQHHSLPLLPSLNQASG